MKYVGHHAPREVVEVNEWLVKGLLESKMYELVNKPKQVTKDFEVKSKRHDKPKLVPLDNKNDN